MANWNSQNLVGEIRLTVAMLLNAMSPHIRPSVYEFAVFTLFVPVSCNAS